MDPELKAYLDGMQQRITQQMGDMRRELTQQIVESREHAEQLNRETRILVEDVRHQVQLVAENVSIGHEKLDRFHDDVQTQIVQLDRRVMRLEGGRSANR